MHASARMRALCVRGSPHESRSRVRHMHARARVTPSPCMFVRVIACMCVCAAPRSHTRECKRPKCEPLTAFPNMNAVPPPPPISASEEHSRSIVFAMTSKASRAIK
eukprot:4206490-Pleurochrysis_carterae.AAC.2